MRFLLVFTLLATVLIGNPAPKSQPMTSPASPISSPEIESLKKDIHTIESRLQWSRNRQDWWNNLYLGLGWAAVLLAMAFGIGSLYSQRKASRIEFNSRPDADLLAAKNALLRNVIDKAAQVEVAVAQKDASDAKERAGRAEEGAGEAKERAIKAQASLATAEQHAAEASAKAEEFRLDIAKANESAVQAQAQVATATAQAALAKLETEKLKAVVTWRTITPEMATVLRRVLSRKPGGVNLRYTDGDPEALYLAIQVSRILEAANWQVASGSKNFAGTLLFGISLPNSEGTDAKTLRDAFTAARIPFSSAPMPQTGISIETMVSTIPGAPTLMIGSRPPIDP